MGEKEASSYENVCKVSMIVKIVSAYKYEITYLCNIKTKT